MLKRTIRIIQSKQVHCIELLCDDQPDWKMDKPLVVEASSSTV